MAETLTLERIHEIQRQKLEELTEGQKISFADGSWLIVQGHVTQLVLGGDYFRSASRVETVRYEEGRRIPAVSSESAKAHQERGIGLWIGFDVANGKLFFTGNASDQDLKERDKHY